MGYRSAGDLSRFRFFYLHLTALIAVIAAVSIELAQSL